MTAKKRLVRSTTDTKLGGVCAGIADYLDTDPTVIRAVWLVLTIFTGFFPGIALYLILWVIMPEGDALPPEEVD